MFLTKNITYTGIEDKGLTVRLTDSEKNKWIIWKSKQDGTEGEAYGSLGNYKIGETFGISYQEKPKTFINDQGKTINFTERTIYSILPVLPEGAQQRPTQQEKPRHVANNAPQSQEKDDSFWDKKAYKQCLWNYWLEHNSHSETDWMMTNVEFQKVYAIFQAINQDAEKRFSPVAQAALKANPNFFETVQPDAESVPPLDYAVQQIHVDDIPFN